MDFLGMAKSGVIGQGAQEDPVENVTGVSRSPIPPVHRGYENPVFETMLANRDKEFRKITEPCVIRGGALGDPAGHVNDLQMSAGAPPLETTSASHASEPQCDTMRDMMRSYGSLISKIREEPDHVIGSTVLSHNTNEQRYPVDYTVGISRANNSYWEGDGRKTTSLAVEDKSDLSNVPDEERVVSHQPQEHPRADQPPTRCDYTLAGTPNENFPETAYWPFMNNMPHNTPHLNSMTSRPYAHSNAYSTREQPVAFCEWPLKSCDYTLADTPYEKSLKTVTVRNPLMYKIQDNTLPMNNPCEQRASVCDYTSPPGFDESKRRKVTPARGKQLDDVHWGCAVCNFTTSNKWDLDNHVKTHRQVTPFFCRVCNYYFASESALESHLKGHHYDGNKEQRHTVSNSSVENRTNPSGNPGKARCRPGAVFEPTPECCDYRLANTSDVEVIPKPDFGYRLCTPGNSLPGLLNSSGMPNDAFPADMQGSQKISTEGWSFSCPVCDFRTYNKWNLVNHVGLHFRETPLPCPVCKSYYANDLVLESHLRSHHYYGDYEQQRAILNPSSQNGPKLSEYASTNSRDLQKYPRPYCDYILTGATNEGLPQNDSRCRPFTHGNTPTYASVKSSQRTNDAFSPYSSAIQEANSSGNCDSTFSKSHFVGADCALTPDCEYTLSGTPNEERLATVTGYKPFPRENAVHATVKRSERTNNSCSAHLKSFSCVLCAFRTNSKRDLWNHVNLHLRETPFQCKACKYYFANGLELESHFRSHHFGCQEQTSVVVNPSIQAEAGASGSCDYKSVNLHHPQKPASADCGKQPEGCDSSTVGASPLNAPYLKTDFGYVPLMQGIHDKTSIDASSSSLGRTEESKKYACDACPYTSTHYYLLKRHQMTHEKQFSCPICSFTTAWKYNLRNHVRVHCKVTPYCCGVCKYYFKNASTLETHWKRHHEGQTYCILPNPSVDEPNSKGNRQDPSRNFQNPYADQKAEDCDYVLAQEGPPKTDARKRPFMHDNAYAAAAAVQFLGGTNAGMETGLCDVSDFTLPNDVWYPSHPNGHKMSHTLDKAFSCGACNFRSDTKSNLEHHERSHQVRTSFCCLACCYYFACQSDLESHLRSRHCDDDREIPLPNPSKPIEESNSCGDRDSPPSSSVPSPVSPGGDYDAPHEECDYTPAGTSDVNMLLKHDTEATPASTNTEERRLLRDENGLSCDTNSASKSQLKGSTGELSSSATNESDLQIPDHAEEGDASALQAYTKCNAEENPFTPEACDFSFSDASPSESHQMAHDEPETFLCEFCACTFVGVSDFESHMSNHTDDMPGACDDESRNSQTSTKRRTVDKKYACEVCDFRCAHSSYLMVHRRIHTGQNPYKCTVCGYSSAFLPRLKQHMASHSGKTAVACGVCDFKTDYPTILKKHLRAHTGQKIYECTICDYSSSYQSTLKQHMVTHSGQKPFECGFCDFKTAYPAVIKKHESAHTGEKLFSCTDCDYKCDRKTDLRAHLKTHSDEEQGTPTCYVCGHESTNLTALKDHVKTHIQNNPLSSNSSESKCTNMQTQEEVPSMERFTCEMCEYTSTKAVKMERHKIRMKHNIVMSDKFAEKRRLMYLLRE